MGSPFESLFAEAAAWLAQEGGDHRFTQSVVERGRALRKHVPKERANDWDTLIAGFAKEETDPKRRARVEGLARACKLFTEAHVPPPMLEWESPLSALTGVGPKTGAALADIGISRVGEMVWLLPVAWQDLTAPRSLSEVIAQKKDAPADAERESDARVVVTAEVKSSGVIGLRGRKTVRVALVDGDAKLACFWFFLAHGVLKVAAPGARVIVVGRIKQNERGGLSMAHPDIFRDEPSARRLLPRYIVPGVKNATLRAATSGAVTRLTRLPDPIPADIATRSGMPPARDVHAALARIHGAENSKVPDANDVRIARERLAWTEAFVRVWQRISEVHVKSRATPLKKATAAITRLSAELGFSWTRGQEEAIREICADLTRDTPMRRLLCGDVGTGKTAVALCAIAQCVNAKKQAAILAPTGILAEQYMEAVGPLARATGARIALAVGNMQRAHKSRLAQEIAGGAVDLVVGTHALLGQAFTFKDLALVVVDEQQRLGVAQRLALVQKGKRPHLLSLSATPIPRTLALALLGDIAMSTIDERPRGRPPVVTELLSRTQEDVLLEKIRAAVNRDERVFVIAPRIHPDEEDDEGGSGAPLSAIELEAWLTKKLPKEVVAIVHGGLPFEEKRAVMAQFRSGKKQVLVGTTVLEVGVDVPEATLICILGAERFGLSQLHQLRGRVGRGSVPGRAVLVHEPKLDGAGKERLAALVRLDRGAEIARVDLELRGAGDLSGTDQSGEYSDFVFLDPLSEPPWLADVENDARRIFKADPSLKEPAHLALALLRARFERLLAIREESG